jgi:hypothetical protein
MSTTRTGAVVGLLGAVMLGACDRRPIDATAALPAPGAAAPAFAFPRYGGPDSVRAAELRGRPTVVALWSTHCPYQGPWVAAFDGLARAL